MDTIPANLCMLIEQLEDSRQFHQLAAEASTGTMGDSHREKSLAYAAMLSEIRVWKSRANGCDEPQQPAAPLDPSDHPHGSDSYVALLERVYRIHRAVAAHGAVAPVATSIRIRAADDATDGEAMDGRRRARVA